MVIFLCLLRRNTRRDEFPSKPLKVGTFAHELWFFIDDGDFSEHYEEPEKVLKNPQTISRLLTGINVSKRNYWIHGNWRQIEPVEEKYSPLCEKFFRTEAESCERQYLIDQIKNQT